MTISFHLSDHNSVCLFVCQSVHLLVSLFMRPSICFTNCPSNHTSLCQWVCQIVCPSIQNAVLILAITLENKECGFSGYSSWFHHFFERKNTQKPKFRNFVRTPIYLFLNLTHITARAHFLTVHRVCTSYPWSFTSKEQKQDMFQEFWNVEPIPVQIWVYDISYTINFLFDLFPSVICWLLILLVTKNMNSIIFT